MKQEKSLKRQLTYTWTFAFAIIAILLLIFDFYAISRTYYQMKFDATSEIEKLVSDTQDAMQNVDNTLAMLFFNSPDFETMSTKKDTVQSYGAAYNLDSMMQSCLLSESGFRGYIVSYDGGKHVLYRFVDTVSNEEKTQAVQIIKDSVEPLINMNEWILIQTDACTYYAKVYQKRYGSVIGLVSLSYDEQVSESIMGMKPQIVLTKGGEAVTGMELAKELSLTTALEEGKTGTWENRNYVVTQKAIGSSNLMLHMVFRKNWQYYLQISQVVIILLSAVCLFVLVVLMRHLNQKMINSLAELKDTMEQIRDNNWDVEINRNAEFLEIKEVNEMFGQMMEQIRCLKIASYEEKIKKQKAELTYFQLQIRPHFYLNCLKTMNALVTEERYHKIQDLIFAISEHMRYLLKMEKDMVTLKEEVSYTENYQKLQNELLERRAVCLWNIAPELAQAKVPFLTIQTFVENAFKYYKPQKEGEELKLQIRAIKLSAEDGEYVDLTIRDNGSGYPDKVLEVINAWESDETVGVGITNLKNRCAILYHGKAEYNFYNSRGAVSELILPYVADEESAASSEALIGKKEGGK
ncbi:MAG: histidine kinase [Eubacteriales bacterium]|nr:histidine kinase [Eubacteriales bacterium]